MAIVVERFRGTLEELVEFSSRGIAEARGGNAFKGANLDGFVLMILTF